MTFDEPAISEIWPENVVAAERAIISLLAVGDPVVFGCRLVARQFFSPRHQSIWAAGQSLYDRNEPVEVVTISDELARSDRLSAVGGLAYLSKFLLHTPSSQLADSYAEIIKQAWTGRELRRVTSEVSASLAVGNSVYAVADRLRAFLDRIEENTDECTSLATELGAEIGRIASDTALLQKGQATTTGLPTGLGLEQIVPGGLPRDRVTLIFGETGTYKTAIKQWMSDAIASSGHYVLDFSLEDSPELTAQRFLSRHTGIPYGRIAARELAPAELVLVNSLTPAALEVAARTIVVGNVPGTIEEAIRLSRHWARQVKLAAVFLDYVQILDQGRQENEATAIYKICLQAQRAAKRDNLAWILISQMNRHYARRDDKRPLLTDLYGSSGIAQTVKLAIGIYRPFVYDQVPAKDSQWNSLYVNHPNGTEQYKNALELWVRKSVAGETGVFVPVLVDRPTGRMTPTVLH